MYCTDNNRGTDFESEVRNETMPPAQSTLQTFKAADILYDGRISEAALLKNNRVLGPELLRN